MKARPLSVLMIGMFLLCSCDTNESRLVVPVNTPAKENYRFFTVTGLIDGSEQFIFTRDRILWVHKYWAAPVEMTFCGQPWPDLRQTPPAWTNTANLNLTKARIVEREGRDLIALEITKDGFILSLSDSPNDAEYYAVTIAIPPLGR